MLLTRIIPCLDIAAGRVVKGVRFSSLRDSGDPAALAREYYAQGADEIAFLDIMATASSQQTMFAVVEAVSRDIFVPLTVGGGIRTLADMTKALHAGADKVAICSAALQNPQLIAQGAERFGSQCIVLSVDAARAGASWHAYTHGGRQDSGVDVLEWVQRAVALGAGEVLLNSIDCDGVRMGYDLELCRAVSAAVHVPLIASGGAGTVEHMADAVLQGRADAVLLASLLHSGELTIGRIKEDLKQKGVQVR